MSKMLAADKKRLKELHDKVHGVVYMATCSATGKKYVGKTTKTMEVRMRKHNWMAGRKTLLHTDIERYGKDSFDWCVLAEADNHEMLDFMERHFIQLHASVAPHGYNMNRGGAGIEKHSEETKKKISDAQIGRVITDEARANLSESLMGHSVSEETRRKIGDANRGFKHKQETIDEMSRSRKGRPISDSAKKNMATAQQEARKHRSGKCKSRNIRVDGVFYYSIKEAHEDTGIARHGLARVAVMSADGVLDVDSSVFARRKKNV